MIKNSRLKKTKIFHLYSKVSFIQVIKLEIILKYQYSSFILYFYILVEIAFLNQGHLQNCI